MTNDKDSEVLVEDFEIIVGSKHHKTKVSQSELLRLINGGTKIHHIKALRQLTQSDEEGPCLKCNAAGDDCGEHAPSWEELSVYWKAEAERLRQPTQSDALAPIGTEGKYVFAGLEVSCRVTAHIEGWLEVEFLLDRSSAIIRPSRFIPLQEQSPFAQSIPSLHIHLQKTQISRPSNLHKTQIAKPERPDMTDTVLRQDVIDAIEALSPDGLKPKGVGLVANITIKKALAAINVIPAVDEWRDIKDAPRNGTVFLAIRPTGAGHPSYMLPYVMRHEGRLYSTFQYNNGSLWVDWPKPDPTLWKPIDMPSL